MRGFGLDTRCLAVRFDRGRRCRCRARLKIAPPDPTIGEQLALGHNDSWTMGSLTTRRLWHFPQTILCGFGNLETYRQHQSQGCYRREHQSRPRRLVVAFC